MSVRALVVDDNEQFLEAASRRLEREGIVVVGVATSGAQALERARELRPDVTLVDIHLGEESGFDLVRRLGDDTGGRSRIILISTHDHEDFADLVAESWAIGFLSKSSLSASAIRELLARGDLRSDPGDAKNG